MVSDFFKEQQSLINHFFQTVDYVNIDRFVCKINECKGMIFLTGIGKSGIIANNISQLLVSIGIRAMFLDPVNALHGDIGILSADDIVVLFSRSGQTAELLNLMPIIRHKLVYSIAVVANKECNLVKQCDDNVILPLLRELCPFDLAPTTSSIIQLIFGNTIVSYLMKLRGLTREEYAVNHPAGRIGKRLTLTVVDIMKSINDIAICSEDNKLIEQIGNMSAKKCGCLLIVNDKVELLGIFTDGDLRRSIELFGSEAINKKLGELMIRKPQVINENSMAITAMRQMEYPENDISQKRVKELPVVAKDNKLVGLILLHDIVKLGL